MNKHPNLLSAANSLLAVVDVQPKLAAVMADMEPLRKHLDILLEATQQLFVPVVVTEQYPQGLGHTEPPILAKLPELTPVFTKTGFSSGAAEGFIEMLQQSGRKQIVITGIESHVCVLQTALDLLSQGYQVQVVEDAVTSRNLSHKRYALDRLHHQGVTITNHESVLFEWLRDAAHPEFKSLAKLLR